MLQSFERRTGCRAYSEYHYTDISAAYFEKASSRFSEFRSRMTFKTYNLDEDIAEQGLLPGGYDLVLAGAVLHATVDITATVRRVRALLKPGGRAIIAEPIRPEGLL
ncbi:S-adenosyl-L-methionine-dependent methyltransferase [Hypoxylon sp. FL1284]|nr:S-adenosyl-L-methionine-dependent methyltransferase [Hypoxylon sp. FL1284]